MKFANTVKKLGIVGLSVLGLSAGVSQADYGRPYSNPWLAQQQTNYHDDLMQRQARFDMRIDNQLKRILTGMEQGKLTMREAIGLLREHQAINAVQRQYLMDGRLGPNEMFDLERRLDQAGMQIRWEKHDGERTGFNDRRDAWGR